LRWCCYGDPSLPAVLFLDLDREMPSLGTFGRIVVLGCLHFRNFRRGTRLCGFQEDNRSTWLGIVVFFSVVENQ